ncbi:MAG: helix-turn-helix domain-containing protein [Candidatus Omnitrophica bacterium]|nr:helix-turn-helix domain-containing protein [Candidatus Omnitrophota bacterium]
MERLLKINEVSDMLQVSRKTIYNWVCYGYIPHFKVYNTRGHGGVLRFRESDLEKWLQRRKQDGRVTYKDMIFSQHN